MPVHMSQDTEAKVTGVPSPVMSRTDDSSSAKSFTEFDVRELLTNPMWGELAQDCIKVLRNLYIFANKLSLEIFRVRYLSFDMRIFVIRWLFEPYTDPSIATSVDIIFRQAYQGIHIPLMIYSQLGEFLKEAVTIANTTWDLQLKLINIIDRSQGSSRAGTIQYIKLFYPEIIDEFTESDIVGPLLQKLRPATIYMCDRWVPIPATIKNSDRGIISLFNVLRCQLRVTTRAVSAYYKLIGEIANIYDRLGPIWATSDSILVQSFLQDASEDEKNKTRDRNLEQHFPAARFNSTMEFANKFVAHRNDIDSIINYFEDLNLE